MDALPADCVRVALHDFRERIDWVLAGINAGGNLGVDIYYSGTVAAAREAAIHGLPAIAVSYYHDRLLTPEDWLRASAWLRPILADILARPGVAGRFLERQPAVSAGSEPAAAARGRVPRRYFSPAIGLPLRQTGDTLTPAAIGSGRAARVSDVDVCFGGGISLSRLELP